MKSKILVFILMALVLLTACAGENNQNETQDIKGLVNDYSVRNITGGSASITSTELIVTNDSNKEVRYDISEEDFFVSVAPFISETHPCDIHSLTGCQGELVDQDFDLYIEDEAGNVVVDEAMNSGENGFIDLWLPRDQILKVTITHDGKEVESEISTFETSGTCITTMQLS